MCSSKAVFRAPSSPSPRLRSRSMMVFGWRCWPARVPGEEPEIFRARSRDEVGAVPEVLLEEFSEGLRDGHWMRAERDPDRAGGVVEGGDCVGAERGHPNQGLGIEEEQYSGDSAWQALAGACE